SSVASANFWIRSCVTTNQSVAGNSRPSHCFKKFKFSISNGGIGVFHDDINRHPAEDNEGNFIPARRLDTSGHFYARRSERGTSCCRSHGRRILGQRSGTESAGDSRKEAGRRDGSVAEIGGARSDRDGDPGRIW